MKPCGKCGACIRNRFRHELAPVDECYALAFPAAPAEPPSTSPPEPSPPTEPKS